LTSMGPVEDDPTWVPLVPIWPLLHVPPENSVKVTFPVGVALSLPATLTASNTDAGSVSGALTMPMPDHTKVVTTAVGQGTIVNGSQGPVDGGSVPSPRYVATK
jgi:hypothetical protein